MVCDIPKLQFRSLHLDWKSLSVGCVLTLRHLMDLEDEFSDIHSDSVPSEVRDWLASTFTRQRALMRRNEDKHRFRSIVHAVQAGIFVERFGKSSMKLTY